MRKIPVFIELVRPTHWIKNLLVFAAVLFSRRYGSVEAWLNSLAGFTSFCLLAGGVYAFNDIFDRRADAAHPKWCKRPVASGRLSVSEAGVFGILLLGGGLVVANILGWRFFVVAGAYIVLNSMYNALFRHRAIIDVVAIAMGFVLRAIAGGAAIGVPVSVWLVICTFMLCVFLGLIKRRGDVAALGKEKAVSARPVQAFYTLLRLDHMLAVSAGLAVLTYTCYCLLGEHSPGPHMVWTVPVVLYGMFRLYGLAVGSSPVGPVELIRRDPVLWIVAAVWLAMTIGVMEFSGHWILRGWLTG